MTHRFYVLLKQEDSRKEYPSRQFFKRRSELSSLMDNVLLQNDTALLKWIKRIEAPNGVYLRSEQCCFEWLNA